MNVCTQCILFSMYINLCIYEIKAMLMDCIFNNSHYYVPYKFIVILVLNALFCYFGNDIFHKSNSAIDKMFEFCE